MHFPGDCKKKRSSEDPQAQAEKVADLVLQQAHYYSMMSNLPKEHTDRQKRQNRGSISRNVLILIDSSGSISDDTFNKTLTHLTTLAHLLCGEISIGVLTYSGVVELVLCPTCFRSDTITEGDYLSMVTQKINEIVHHRGLTYTGEAIACLRCSIMMSTSCVKGNSPTEVIVFTDGLHNGCTDPQAEVAKFTADYGSVPIYAIGMGSVNRNGVTDLYGGNRNPDSIFNVRDIDMFAKVLDEILKVLVNTGGSCSLTGRSEQVIRDLLQQL